ncbi:TetR/AcrR family transcriptional regulator [Halodesulfovibrio spirochaetisodalis]|uniref:TetR family transcriptional regulator n=1 Tax=Halodesulfovibrio spirochaetisodalis TaxID=1560234 RepID=A0A1B7X9F0_9BACT|nr:TetR/AcrR family transcriptional regulator [Halodesulfovibrio spirochaetisodalis]OBQ46005.1 TetR family transcriptional regulator [Halodesulfovibrio spirochaetisodalis]
MPKIVDHAKMREEIALKAASVFLEYGYKGISMRQLCKHIEMSKSAVYHYFKSKDEIFKASTEAIVNYDFEVLSDVPLANVASLDEKCQNFERLFRVLSSRFFQELNLVMEYIETIGEDVVAKDELMNISNKKYQELLFRFVDEENSSTLYTMLLGLLTHRVLRGEDFSSEEIQLVARRQLTARV